MNIPINKDTCSGQSYMIFHELGKIIIELESGAISGSEVNRELRRVAWMVRTIAIDWDRKGCRDSTKSVLSAFDKLINTWSGRVNRGESDPGVMRARTRLQRLKTEVYDAMDQSRLLYPELYEEVTA